MSLYNPNMATFLQASFNCKSDISRADARNCGRREYRPRRRPRIVWRTEFPGPRLAALSGRCQWCPSFAASTTRSNLLDGPRVEDPLTGRDDGHARSPPLSSPPLVQGLVTAEPRRCGRVDGRECRSLQRGGVFSARHIAGGTLVVSSLKKFADGARRFTSTSW
ncbi:hypothetical protein HPB50_023049 [Hyalomma asiaticum]|uniref:Uncharacterized protein n=1 Tax=Hyalomma asiaticum TaxID=266040 RepID=A0ACB7TPQ9_HYAAI|nr:hypothetical protein HPB50_023049 [Hyalomma asiaticum]